MKKTVISLLSLGTLAFASAAIAQPAPMPGGPKDGHQPMHHHGMMAKMDTNKDGVLTRAEALDAAGKRFDEMDANHDGKVTKEEAKAHHEAMRAKWQAKKAGMEANQTNVAK